MEVGTLGFRPFAHPAVLAIAFVGLSIASAPQGEALAAAHSSAQTYEVRPGDSLWSIARSLGVDVEALVAANGLKDADKIQAGQKLVIPGASALAAPQPVVHKVGKGESLWSIARQYGVDLDALVAANGITNPDHVVVGQELVIPNGSEPVARRQQVLVSRGRLQPVFAAPVRGPLTSRYGPRWGRQHEGIDIAVNTGTPVRASADGVVRFAGENGGYGLLVVIDHGFDVETRYAHNSRILVREGERVQAGDVIALSGNTGNSTGPHVHFEIRIRGEAVDPLPYLREPIDR